ncbi:interleukin-7 isoform X3 [Oryctolagus cuniculus]|uniref:interleukin-7 isoform X3 n=1 Tax=Oryctolagus cuniculus TaxID=9986 RepID=UPI003879B7D6
MFHVSFRYIFGIPPLILVLLPVTSSNCDIEKIKHGKEYENVLMISINELGLAEDVAHWPLDKMIEIGSNCLNNESNFFKKHSCDDNKEADFLERAARKLDQFHDMSINEDFQNHLERVSKGTLTLVNCTGRKETFKGSEKEWPVFPKETTTKDKNLLE